jgi:hypothetical protein
VRLRYRLGSVLFVGAWVVALGVVVARAENTRWGTAVFVGALGAFLLSLLLTGRRDRTTILLVLAVALYTAYFVTASYSGVPRWLKVTVGVALGGGYLLNWLVIPFVRAFASGFRGGRPR